MYKTNPKEHSVDNLIDENTSFEDLVEKIFNIYFEEILSKHKLLSDSYDVENLHKIRIGLRKFKSFLSFIKNEIPKKEWKYANNLYKNLIKPTSKARDYDVFKNEYLSPTFIHNKKIFGGQEIYEIFENKQKLLHEYIENHITSKNYINDLNDLNDWIIKLQWRRKFSESKKFKGKGLILLVNSMVQHRYKRIVKNKKQVLNFNQKELHRYRVEIKELRYTIEVLEPYIEHSKKEAKILKNMQEILGKINDTYTAECIIQQFNISNNHASSRSYIEKRAIDQRHRYLIQLDNIK